MSDGQAQKCPDCGRPLYSDRPACMYCGYERPIDASTRLQMKKRLVARTLGVEGAEEPIAVAHEAEYKCPQCKRPVSPDMKFCTGCGYRISAGGLLPSRGTDSVPVEQPPSEKTPFRVFRSFSPDFSMDFRDYLSSDNLLYLSALVFMFISMCLPFGEVPRDMQTRETFVAIVIPYPPVLKILFFMAVLFIFVDMFRMIQVISAEKIFIAIEVVTILVCVFAAREIFYSVSTIVIFGLMFAAVHTWTRKLVLRTTLEDFWAVCILFISIMIILITPYIRTIILSGTPRGVFANYGFLVHILSAGCLLAGAIIRGRRIVILE